MFAPVCHLTPAIAKSLMAIDAARTAIEVLPIDVPMLATLRQTARLLATHLSTRIEGNRLTQAEVQDALTGAHFPGRERDEAEVRNYYRALEAIDALAAAHGRINETDLKRIHGLVMTGRRNPTRYRDGQTVIRDARSGGVIYLPPEAADVPALMRQLFAWINREMQQSHLPAPIIAALAHYQYATIHPYYDGNGRTARLLTNLILHKSGYGLKGIYSLEEYYAQDVQGYYAALATGPSHNYYFGRVEADVTGFVAYFCTGMASAFTTVRARATEASQRQTPDLAALLRQLDPRQRRLLELFRDRGSVTAGEIAGFLKLGHRTVVALCRGWVAAGFLCASDPSRKNRAYRLAERYEGAVGEGRWR